MAYLLNAGALAILIGVEFVINLVFVELPPAVIGYLRAGPLGMALAIASEMFLVGSLAFVAALFAPRELPVVPLVLCAVGAIPIALLAVVPEAALNLGLVAVAVAVAWLAAWLFRSTDRGFDARAR